MSKPSWPIIGPPVRGRSCGSCQSCCVWVPVDRPLNKPAGVKCQHQCSKGCGIYDTRPDPCRAWNCTWLYQPETKDMRRPDQAGYVVDPMPQVVLANGEPLYVLQVWVDPARPNAHRDPALRAYLSWAAETYGFPAVVRWAVPGSQEGRDALCVFAPPLTPDREWVEVLSPMVSEEKLARDVADTGKNPVLCSNEHLPRSDQDTSHSPPKRERV